MTTGAWIVLAAVVVAMGFGSWRLATDGRFRGTHVVRTPPEAAAPAAVPHPTGTAAPAGAELVAAVGEQLGERATLLQFSSAFCAPCRATRRVLGEVVELVGGVVHVEVDAEQHLDVVRRLGILKTPTTLVLNSRGEEVRRAAGQPRKADVLAALGQALP